MLKADSFGVNSQINNVYDVCMTCMMIVLKSLCSFASYTCSLFEKVYVVIDTQHSKSKIRNTQSLDFFRFTYFSVRAECPRLYACVFILLHIFLPSGRLAHGVEYPNAKLM